MRCPACGRKNRDEAGYCAWCGAALVEETLHARGAKALEPPTAVESESTLEIEPARDTRRLADTGIPTVKLASPVGDAFLLSADNEEHVAASGEAARDQDANAPLRPGDILAQRYEIVELIEHSPEHNRYRAKDLKRCTACSYDDNALEDAYCRECGASLAVPALVLIAEHVRLVPEAYDWQFTEGARDYYIRVESAPTPPQTSASHHPLRLIWGRAIDQGLQRDHNEDYVEAWFYTRGSGGLLGLFVVADGLGGQDSGEVASRMATDAVWQALRETVWEPVIRGEKPTPDTIEQRLIEAIKTANRQIYDARITRRSEMSTTLTLALIVDDIAYIGNVGDSRTYVWNARGLQRITKDHSLVQRLVDTGQLKPEEVYTHPQRNLIYQSIGDRPDIRPDAFRHPLAVDDRLILCSDGLWEMVREDGLEEVLLAEPDPQRAAERLIHNANLAGGEDNIAVLIVQAIAS